MADFRLQIVTQQKTVFDSNVTALTMPGEGGSFGVMANHAPIIAVLQAGTVKCRTGNRTEEFEIGAGFFDMENNKATMLVDSIDGLKTAESEEED